ncbi:MAG: thiamine pyrophosphate-dependent dehydrogenase E1 component subunit alpha [Candidatus Bathyarchaeia archaeon]
MEAGSELSVTIGKEKLKSLYEKMVLCRLFEDKAYELFSQNMIPGTLHLYAGQEAVAVGVIEALRSDDYIESTHRGHGHCVAKGADLGRMMAELMGKKTGYCKGKGGSMHVADFSKGNLGAEGVVAAGLPIAVGAALAIKLKRQDRVVACFFGDGAANNGTFGESLNMASIWKLPVIFVCENNLYAMSVPQVYASSVKDIAVRAAGYNMPGVVVDGMDVIAVYQAASQAAERARKGDGPTLLECKTYRWRGHSRLKSHESRLFFPGEYEEWRKKDPLTIFKQRNLIPAEELERIEKEAADRLEKAVQFAAESPYPDPQEALEDVYA